MNETGLQVLSDIENIKTSLEIISKNGIPIIDTFSPITTSVNIMTTIFSTAFGGWITILLFKGQEKMRIREELIISFYQEYKNIYNRLIKELLYVRKQRDSLYTLCIMSEGFSRNKERIFSKQKESIICLLDKLDIIGNSMYELENLINSNEIISKNILSNDFEGLFGIPRRLILSMYMELLLLRDFDNASDFNLYLKSDSSFETDSKQQITDSINRIKKANDEIQSKCIGQYFKPKWYQFKRYKNAK